MTTVSVSSAPSSAPPPSQAIVPDHRGVRRAISLSFGLQGFIIGSWALHVPFLVERLGITKSAMGLVIVMFGIGSVIAMALLAVVLPRTGSRLPAGIASVLTSFFVLALALTRTIEPRCGSRPSCRRWSGSRPSPSTPKGRSWSDERGER